jgi:hypothetical protein
VQYLHIATRTYSLSVIVQDRLKLEKEFATGFKKTMFGTYLPPHGGHRHWPEIEGKLLFPHGGSHSHIKLL